MAGFFKKSILMPLDDLRDLKGMPKDKIPEFIILLSDSSKTDHVIKLINFRFKDDVIAFGSQNFGDSFSSIIDTLRLLVLVIALIAAIVAGIGILNTMLMSVLERFQEIGTLKAVGWSGYNIMQLILFESFVLGLLGSLCGILFGIAFGLFVIQDQIGLTVVFQPYLLIGAFSFGLIISVLAGIYPAGIASKLDPIEALRIE